MLILGWSEIVGWFNGMLISLSTIPFKFVNIVYRIFLQLAETNIFNESAYKSLTTNIYRIIAVVMLFVLAYAILLKIVDPDGSSKGIDGKQVLIKFVTAIVLIILCPSIFSFAYGLQSTVLRSGVIGGIFTGQVNNGSQRGAVGNKNGGIIMSVNTYLPFFTNETGNDEAADKALKNSTALGVITRYTPAGEEAVLNCKKKKSCTFAEVKAFASATGSFAGFRAFANNWYDGEVSCDWLLALIVGCFLLYVIVSFCFDLGVRVCKLAFFQIIAPLAFICMAIPKMDDIYKKWLKNTMSTFMGVFTRVLVMNFGVYLISLVATVNLFGDSSAGTGNIILNLFGTVFLILGIISFVHQAPKLLSDLFGIGDGDMKLGIADKFKASMPYVTGSAVGAAIAGHGNPVSFFRGMNRGIKNKDFTAIGQEATRRRNRIEAEHEGATTSSLAVDRMRRMFGFETSKEAADHAIENGTYTITDKDGNVIDATPDFVKKQNEDKDKLNLKTSQITDAMRKNIDAKSNNEILTSTQDAIKSAAISDLSKADSKILETLQVSTGYTEQQRAADLENLDEIYTRPGSDMSLAEYEERRAAINNRQTMLDLTGNYTSLKEQLDNSYKNGAISNEAYQAAAIKLAETQKSMVENYVTAAATGTQYNGVDVDKSGKIKANYDKFLADFNAGTMHDADGNRIDQATRDAMINGLEGWDLLDKVSKEAGSINLQLDAKNSANERSKRNIDQEIKEIDGLLDQVAKQKQQQKNTPGYKASSAASNFHDNTK